MKSSKLQRMAMILLAGLLLVASIVLTLVPNGWNRVFSFVHLTEFDDGAEEAPFALYVLDVGKADAIVVRCGSKVMLVDCGMADDGETVARFLKKRTMSHLTYAVNTHPDSDHIGGYPDLLQSVTTDCFCIPSLSEEFLSQNSDYLLTAEALELHDVLTKTWLAGDTFSLGSATIEVLWPSTAMDSTNDSSLVLRITYGETSFLLMGDAGEEVEEALLKSGVSLESTVLKVGHHGSKTATTVSFLQAVSPKYAAISVGDDSSHLPKEETLRRLTAQNVTTYRTDTDGDLLFTSDGQTVKVLPEKTA